MKSVNSLSFICPRAKVQLSVLTTAWFEIKFQTQATQKKLLTKNGRWSVLKLVIFISMCIIAMFIYIFATCPNMFWQFVVGLCETPNKFSPEKCLSYSKVILEFSINLDLKYRIRANTVPLLIRTPSWLERRRFAIF